MIAYFVNKTLLPKIKPDVTAENVGRLSFDTQCTAYQLYSILVEKWGSRVASIYKFKTVETISFKTDFIEFEDLKIWE